MKAHLELVDVHCALLLLETSTLGPDLTCISGCNDEVPAYRVGGGDSFDVDADVPALVFASREEGIEFVLFLVRFDGVPRGSGVAERIDILRNAAKSTSGPHPQGKKSKPFGWWSKRRE